MRIFVTRKNHSRVVVQKMQNVSAGVLAQMNSIFGCSFFAYNWKLPAYNGAFLLTFDKYSFLLTVGAFWLTILASLLTVGAFLLTMGKCV